MTAFDPEQTYTNAAFSGLSAAMLGYVFLFSELLFLIGLNFLICFPYRVFYNALSTFFFLYI